MTRELLLRQFFVFRGEGDIYTTHNAARVAMQALSVEVLFEGNEVLKHLKNVLDVRRDEARQR